MPNVRHLDRVKHHYVPQFLLRRWTNASGRLRNFSLQNGRLVSSLRGPKSTGYEDGLYAVVANTVGVPEDAIEHKLFSPIDNDAAQVLDKFERHVAISEDDHIAWTFFLSSLKVRQPETLDFLRTEGMKLLSRIMAEGDERGLPEGWPTTEQFFDRNFPGALATKTLISWLPRMIAHPEVMERFSGLKWWFREFTPADPKLLLSDMPLQWEGGFKKADFRLILPLAPDRIFIGTGTEEIEQFLSHLPASELIQRVNRTALASSSQRIWASPDDANAHAFIEANRAAIGKNIVRFSSIAPWADPATGQTS